MRRQLGADVLKRAAAGDGPGDPRPRVQRRMVRRPIVDPARRSRHRPECEMAGRRGRGRAVPRSQRAGKEGLRRRADRDLPERRASNAGQRLSYFETKNYSQVLPGGRTWRFHFLMEVKSFIAFPSFGHSLKEPGFYTISGVAYSRR